MGKTSLIIKREYLTRVTKKSFLIVTFLVPILFVVVLGGVMFLGLSDSSKHTVLIEDTRGILSMNEQGSVMAKNLSRWQTKKDSSIIYKFTHEEMSVAEFLESDYSLKISIDEQTVNAPSVPMLYKDLPSLQVSESIEEKLQDDFQEYTWKQELEVTPEEYRNAKVNINLVEQDAQNMEVEDPHLRSRGFLGLVFSFIIYITIFLFGSQVMRGVLEEKTNRIVEVLISSVKPFQLLMGKIIGVGMVGLTQFVLWIALFGIFILAGSAILSTTVSPEALAAYVENGSAVSSNATTDLAMEQLGMGDFYSSFISMNWPLTLTCFLFYFIGAYLLYGSLLAAVGAAVDAEADSQQFMMPITIPLIAAIALAQLVIVNPESSIARIFSIFPLTSPIIMLVRVAMKSFEWWELILSMLLLVATFIGSVWVAGRIYRTGILMYGKKASWKELYKWLRH